MASSKSPGAKKLVSKQAILGWEEGLRNSFEFIYDDDTGKKAIKAFCITCKEHCHKIKMKYRGKVADDAVKYGLHGTTYMLKPKFDNL